MRLERNVQKVAEAVEVLLEDPSAGVDDDIVELPRSGDRMGAAKLYSERTGADFVMARAS